MTDAYISSIIERAFANSTFRAMIETDTGKTVDTRKEWIEHSVIPALAKMSVLDSEYYKKLIERLKMFIE
jgi:hypothetical protein